MLESTQEGETTLAQFDERFEATLRLLARKIVDRFGTTAAAFRYVAPGRLQGFLMCLGAIACYCMLLQAIAGDF